MTVVGSLESQEPLWFGEERKKETLDDFCRTQLSREQRGRVEAAFRDMWKPYRMSLEQWALGDGLVYDRFHIL